MCGIVGYVGKKNAIKVIISGLETLEYRGYDSAGIAYRNVNNELKIISLDESKYKEWIIENHNENCPIGRIEDIEIVFVHYTDADTTKEKWNRRVKRINWENLIFKFSYMNHATEKDLKTFDMCELPGKKIMFVNQRNHSYKCGVYYPGFENDKQIYNDTFYWNKYFDVTLFFNTGKIREKYK